MIDVDAFRAAAQRQEEGLSAPSRTFTVEFDQAEAATIQRLAAMAGVTPRLLVQRLATTLPFRTANVMFNKGWTITDPETGQALSVDMRDSQDYWCRAVLDYIGLPLSNPDGSPELAQPR